MTKSDNKRLLKVIRRKCSQYCEHSTLHGFYYFSVQTNCFYYTVWSMVIVSSIVLCGFLSHMIWGRFVEDPTFTVVESLHYPTESIQFSAVALCDSEIYGPRTANITNILALRGYNANQIEDFYKSFTEVENVKYVPELYVAKMHDVLADLGMSYDGLLYQLKKPCDVLIRECLWRSKVRDCKQMFREVFTINGYCCQFDITYFRRQSGDEDINFMAGVETTEALEITVDTRRVLQNGSYADSFVLMYVFDELNSLTLLDSSIILTPRTYFDVTVDVWAIDSSNDVKALSVKNRKCFLDSDGLYSSYQQCVTSFIMREVVDRCRCLPFGFTLSASGHHPACSWEKLLCAHQILAKAQGDIRGILSAHECYQPCDCVQYETQAEYMNLQRTGDSHLSRVTVHYASNICIKYRREVLYTWDQMLANLGGIFGLCLGGSIISIMELIWFVIDLMAALLQAFRRKIRNQNKKQKIFTVNEAMTQKKEGLQVPYMN